MKRRSRLLAGISVLSLFGAVSLAALAAPPAQADVFAVVYASPTGSGSLCTAASPCDLATAQSTARALGPTATGDISVVLAGGTYTLASTLTFTTADQAAGGHKVSYAAAAGAEVIFSGGAPVLGWSLHDVSANIWKASVPAGSNSRQIYVNGIRAGVTSQRVSTVFGSMTKTSTGYSFTGTAANSWSQANGVDLVYTASPAETSPWAQSRCRVSAIADGAISVANPCWRMGNYGHTSDPATDTKFTLGIPSAVENNYALLGQPGQFFLDTPANQIYYVPRPGEDMSTASVVLPRLETLLSVNGTPTAPVSNLSFSGMRFRHATWNFGDEGVLDYQANTLITTAANAQRMLPANVQCHSCVNVSFSDNTFSQLGGAGLSLDGGGADNIIRGNVFTDISSTGIQIGIGSPTEPSALESGTIAVNNYVHNVANEYLGGIGIFAGWVKGTSITHNEVWNVPYTGISLGWGWGFDSTTMVDNHIDRNYIHDVMNSSLVDGGAIYVNGIQGASPPSTILGNYTAGSGTNFASLYLDNGASNWAVTDNVVGAYTPHWLFLQTYAPTADNNRVQTNFSGDHAGPQLQSSNGTNTVSENTTNLATWPAAAQRTITEAGLEPGYLSVRSGTAETNLAYGKPTAVSSSWPGYASTNSNDGNNDSIWSTASGDTTPSWQTDLGSSFPLRTVQVLFRTDGYDNATDATNLKVLVSNETSLTSGVSIACQPTPIPLPASTRFDCRVPAGSWRYVSLVKTDVTGLVFSEVRVYGHGPQRNVALGQPASAATSWSAGFPASKAVDGDKSTIYAGTNTAEQFWAVALPRQYAITQAQLAFRSDGYDYPSERQNFEVQVSNSATFATSTVACSVGAAALAYGSTYSCVLPAGSWQYVRVRKTDSTALVLAEVSLLAD
jgi:hypothetical protein